jgi:hypothetical protein
VIVRFDTNAWISSRRAGFKNPSLRGVFDEAIQRDSESSRHFEDAMSRDDGLCILENYAPIPDTNRR